MFKQICLSERLFFYRRFFMPKAKYDFIYKDLKTRIESGEYEFQELLPSENHLILTYGCSRNTVRRAIAALVTDGYVQTMQGKGVRNIFEPAQQTSFTLGGIESFKESALRNGQVPKTKVLCFTELAADEKVSKKPGSPRFPALLPPTPPLSG